MEVRARYVLIGSFALAVILGLFGFVYWVKNVGGFGEHATYQIRFEQPVSGLTVGSNVLFNGIRAGVITDLAIDASEPRRVNVTIAVDRRVPIRADTQVDITYQGFTGAPAISLKGGEPGAAPLARADHGPPILLAPPGIAQSLSDAARETLRNLNQVVTDNAKPLHAAIEGFSTFSEMLGKNSPRIETMIGGLEKLAGVGEKPKPPPVYDLAAATSFPDSLGKIAARVVVPDPATILVFDTQNILTRSAGGVYGNIENVKWADNLPKLMQARILQSFDNAHQLGAVDRANDQSEGAFRLELGIRHFEISLQAKPTAVVEFSARVASDKGDVAGARMFNASIEAKSDKPDDLVEALNAAFSKAAHDLVVWTVGLKLEKSK